MVDCQLWYGKEDKRLQLSAFQLILPSAECNVKGVHLVAITAAWLEQHAYEIALKTTLKTALGPSNLIFQKEFLELLLYSKRYCGSFQQTPPWMVWFGQLHWHMQVWLFES